MSLCIILHFTAPGTVNARKSMLHAPQVFPLLLDWFFFGGGGLRAQPFHYPVKVSAYLWPGDFRTELKLSSASKYLIRIYWSP
jgi:hypothetical protein